MGRPVNSEKKEIVLRRFYVEKASILRISREEKISRNTIKKYIAENPLTSSPLVLQNVPSAPADQTSLVTNQVVITEDSFKRLHREYRFVANEVEHIVEDSEIMPMAVEIANNLGITSRVDLLRLEKAMEHYLSSLTLSHQVNALITTKLDHCWILQVDKMSRSVSRLMDLSTKKWKAFTDEIKELEIRYNKRYPDLGRLQKVMIQNNQINLSSSAACETSQDQSLRA